MSNSPLWPSQGESRKQQTGIIMPPVKDQNKTNRDELRKGVGVVHAKTYEQR